MKKLIKSFAVKKDGDEVDRFDFYRDGNHGVVNNKRHCLFDGYYLEAYEKFYEIREDIIELCEMTGQQFEEKAE